MANNNQIDEIIKLEPFNSKWNELYTLESIRIKEKIGSKNIAIQHIGSTAISNIYAKPIIDIMIGINDLNHSKSKMIISKLIELGYEYFGEANISGRLYFRMRGANNFNIALCQYQGDIWTNNILFRDYLRKHPDIAATYSKIKKNAFDSGVDTLLKYSEIKRPFIDEIIKYARVELDKK